jgi:hypothetical protein
MKQYEAKKMITEVFENPFEKESYSYFIRNLLKNLHPAEFLRTGYNIPKAFEDFIASYERLGKFEDEDGNLIDALIVKLKRDHSIDYARSTQRNFIRWYLNDKGKDAALVAFHTDKSAEWRFSFIKMQYRLEQKRDELTPAKRSSFLVGETRKSHTAQRQLITLLKNDFAPSLADIEKAFSIEAVSDEFYEKYKILLFNLIDEMEKLIAKNNTLKVELDSKKITSLNFSKKLMGQIVFLYFLQKKGWLGLQEGQKYGEGDKNFLQSLFQKTKSGENFFNDYLEYLFYDALSKTRVTDFYDRFKTRIPFLNGGLFDPIAFYDWQNADILIPNELFSNRKGEEEGTGIFDVFDLYNFTVKEDEPLETEVAIDPEMLGKVFERMLDVTERKSKGAFYTPREIVHYMAQQSLLYYLENALTKTCSFNNLTDEQQDFFGNEGKSGQLDIVIENKACPITKNALEFFIHYGEQMIDKDIAIEQGKLNREQEIPISIRTHAEAIDNALENIKICDPAVGSGAFPVGIMNEIVKLRSLLTPFIQTQTSGTRRSAYRFKANAIKNCLYGVDIDETAVEIAKLRLWLSLIVDEDRIDAIDPLPNLEYKIVKGNSLLGYPYKSGGLEEIEKLKENYYALTDKKEKEREKKEIDAKIENLFAGTLRYLGYQVDFDFRINFSEVFHQKGGFDVVIGNPPYIQGNLANDFVNLFNKIYEVAQYKINSYNLFFELSLKILKQYGYTAYITPKSFLTNKHNNKLRKYLVQQTQIKEIIDFDIHVFQKVNEDVCVTIFQKSYDNKNNKIEIFKCEDLSAINTNIVNKIYQYEIKPESYVININIDSMSKMIISRINDSSQNLGNCFSAYFGIQTHDKNKYVSSDRKGNSYKPVIDGRDIFKYYIKTPQKFVDFRKETIKSGGKKEIYMNSRIVTRQINKYPEFALISPNIYTLNTVYNIYPINKNISLKYCLSIINSNMIKFYWLLNYYDNKATYPKVKKEYIESIPLPQILKENQKPFEKLVDYILFLKTQTDDTMSFYFEQLIDGMVYELYFENEIKQAGCDILKYLNDLPEIKDEMPDEEKMQIIKKVFNKLYDKDSPVRKNLFFMDTVEEVAIIKRSLEK